jgi:ABC-type transport system substrate-binding protein
MASATSSPRRRSRKPAAAPSAWSRPKAFGGPYKLKEWRTGEVIILERNEAWTGEEPAFDEVRLFPIADPQAGEIAFEAGDVDYTQPSAASLARYRATRPPSHGRGIPGPVLRLGRHEHGAPQAQDKRVRQAVQYAINVPLIIEAAYFGIAPTRPASSHPACPAIARRRWCRRKATPRRRASCWPKPAWRARADA